LDNLCVKLLWENGGWEEEFELANPFVHVLLDDELSRLYDDREKCYIEKEADFGKN
jgi:hypothetical protein